MRRHREIAALETAEYQQWIAEQQAQQQAQQEQKMQTDYTENLKASGALAVYHDEQGNTYAETLDHTDTRIVSIADNRGDGLRIDVWLSRADMAAEVDSLHMYLADTYNAAMNAAIVILTS